MSSSVTAFGLGAAIVAFALPSPAGARDGHFTVSFGPGGPSSSAEFKIKASNGYSISVLGTVGHGKRADGQVDLIAQNRDVGEVAYFTQGVVSKGRIKASFGSLGRISVRFHPSHAGHFVPGAENCQGPGELVQPGHFVGTIEFEGEQAYTALHASSATGKVTRSFKENCNEGSESGGGQLPPISVISLTAGSRSGELSLDATRWSSTPHSGFQSFSEFSASIFEAQPPTKSGMLPPLIIIRSIDASAKNIAFNVTKSGGEITSATIAPPAPFAGTATYVKSDGSKGSWSGSLAGNFPGRGELSLAGPEFSAKVSEPFAQHGSG